MPSFISLFPSALLSFHEHLLPGSTLGAGAKAVGRKPSEVNILVEETDMKPGIKQKRKIVTDCDKCCDMLRGNGLQMEHSGKATRRT